MKPTRWKKAFRRLCAAVFALSTALLPGLPILAAKLYYPPTQRDLIPGVVRTNFQVAARYDGGIDIRTDGVMVYLLTPEGLADTFDTWKGKGYAMQCMTYYTRDMSYYIAGKYDGREHYDIVQTRKDGSYFQHTPGTLYTLPSPGFCEYLFSMIKTALDCGAETIVIEEPEIFRGAEYGAYFKQYWRECYGEDWVDPASSRAARYKAELLKKRMLEEGITDIAGRIKAYKPGTQVMIAAHSTISYNSIGILTDNHAIYNLPCVDGYIAQVWTDTARNEIPYEGKRVRRVFQSAFLEYSSIANIRRPGDPKAFFALSDPKADDPAHTWDDYKYWYEETIAAQLMIPSIRNFEVIPWPDRGFAQAPPDYKTAQLSVFSALKDLYDKPLALRSQAPGVTVLLSDSLSWFENPKSSDSFYGMALPLIEKGIPVNILPIENLVSAEDLAGTDILLLSYDLMKPLEEGYHDVIAAWVKAGGVLVYLGGYEQNNRLDAWWNAKGYDSPQMDLFEKLGAGVKRNSEKALWPWILPYWLRPASWRLGSAESGGGWGWMKIPVWSSVSAVTLEGARSLYQLFGRAVAWEQDAGEGTVIGLGLEPYALSRCGGAKLLRSLVEYAAGKRGVAYKESNLLIGARGRYTIAHALDQPETLAGQWIDLFDPRLPVLRAKEIAPHTSALLYDIAGLAGPGILYSTGELTGKAEEARRTVYTIAGPSRSTGAARLHGGGLRPVNVSAYDGAGLAYEVTAEWQEDSGTLLLRHENLPGGLTVAVEWGARPEN
ncbi:MAG: hypothetical protein LBB75_05085 [Oscillospiraceae bacterium]|jgi:hypothetical protein|nr:hypothetical protein [Oscillospiraceae bacterium]